MYKIKSHKITVSALRHCVKSVQIPIIFWSVFSRIRTGYGDLLRKSSYSVRIRENTDQKKLRIWTLHTVRVICNRIQNCNVVTKKGSEKRFCSLRESHYEQGIFSYDLLIFHLQCLVEFTCQFHTSTIYYETLCSIFCNFLRLKVTLFSCQA